MEESKTLEAMDPMPSKDGHRQNALAKGLQAEGIRIQRETLYRTNGHTAGTRVGLFDSAGCFREEFYTLNGTRGRYRLAVSIFVTLEGHPPALWITEACPIN